MANLVNTTNELQLLNELNILKRENSSQKSIKEKENELIDALHGLCEQLDDLYSSDANDELVSGDNVQLLNFLCTTNNPRVADNRNVQLMGDEVKTYPNGVKAKQQITWFTFVIDGDERVYGINHMVDKNNNTTEWVQFIIEEC